MNAIDVHGFAGAMTLGMADAGWQIVGKKEGPGGFGIPLMEANRRFYPGDWVAQAAPAEEWEPRAAELVFGNPPCSGFSNLTDRRPGVNGINAKVNQCMWDLVTYAARCRPQTVAFESVQGAFKQGLPLMRALRDHLEARTGKTYGLTHVLHSAASLNGHAVRNRYFWVASRLPFGVEPVRPIELRTTLLMIADPPQPGDACDGIHSPGCERVNDFARLVGDYWKGGESMAVCANRWLAEGHDLPDSWRAEEGYKGESLDGWRRTLLRVHQFNASRLRGDRLPPVIDGGSPCGRVHPTLPRLVTIRECGRIIGFPEAFSLQPILDRPSRSCWLGKGITVACGRWLGEWIASSMGGDPGTMVGEPMGDKEWKIDLTHDWKQFAPPELSGRGASSRE